MDLTALVLYTLFFGFLTGWLAERKGYGVPTWFALGVLLGAVATYLLYLQPDRARPD